MKLSLRYSLLVGAILGCAARCAATASSEEVLTFSEEFTRISEARDQLEEAVKLRNDAYVATIAASSKVEALKRMVADKQRILHEVTNEGTIEAACQEKAKDPIDACADYMAASESLKVAEQESSTAIDKERACTPAVEAAYRNVIAKIELIEKWAALIAGNEVVERYEARLVKGECCMVEENALEVEKSVDGAVVQDKESCCKSNGKEADESAEQEKEEKKEKKGKKGKKDNDEKEDKDDKETKDMKDKSEKKKETRGKARLSSDEDKAADHEGETKDPKDLAEASTVAPVLKEETGKDTVAPVIKEETGESVLEQKVEKDNSLDNVVADQDSMASFNKPTLVGILSLVSVALFY